MKFRSVDPRENFAEMEKGLLEHWYKDGIVEKYLKKNLSSKEKFSFLDGPITANNPMGVHHAWGRTYKDLWQRFQTMLGKAQRYQNGFDEQGLWVEVEVEKELGLKSKKDIENLVPGSKFESLAKFVNLCKERVKKFSAIQTDQSKRLGYLMDWDNSYHTSSDDNNYAIWNFLKTVHEKGWLYKGHDSVPWCPRCGTAISQHEILTEEYKQLTHESVYFKLPVKGKEKTFLLVWTTTPWTIPANVAVAVGLKHTYLAVAREGSTYVLVDEAAKRLFGEGVKGSKILGKELVGWGYDGPFDDLSRVQASLQGYSHRVVVGDDLILPVGTEEGTGLVHVATGAGTEDFQLGKKENLPVIDVIDETAVYLEGLGELSTQNAKDHPEIIVDALTKKDDGKYLFKVEKYTHRYPTCWRCKQELVWRVVDEWYIAMDRKDDSGKTYREQMVEVAKKINWIPEWGLDRELDWLRNMHDWLISKKRYWGLSLPIWECAKCGNFDVIGSREELKEKATSGWDKFEGNSPHRPWVDEVKIKCSKCSEYSTRIPDVGNPWLDAGIVPFATLPKDWFPADFVTESFPGQFKNWFYSLIAMSTALKSSAPLKNLLGFASVRDEKGEEMHKSKGNSIEFNEAADKIGVDVMRWLYAKNNPEHNVNFGLGAAEEVRRFFHLRLWNVYSFFVLYAGIDNWQPVKSNTEPLGALDKWILSRLVGSIEKIKTGLSKFNAHDPVEEAENFVVNDLSNWYVRRIRDRVGPTVPEGEDKAEAYQALWTVLVEYSKALSPFIPYMTDEIYTNLTGEASVCLTDWPELNSSLRDEKLESEMKEGITLASVIHGFRKGENIKVRIPFRKLSYTGPSEITAEIRKIVQEETNVYDLVYSGKSTSYSVKGETDTSNLDLLAGEARDIVRQIQEKRKELGVRVSDEVTSHLPKWPKEHEDFIKRQTLSKTLVVSADFKVEKT